MATHDRMDLNVRSQAFYRDFYHFCKNSCEMWYIKDANHHLVDASFAFCSRFSLLNVTATNLSSMQNSLFPSGQGDLAMRAFEKQAILQNKEMLIYTCGYLRDSDGCNAFILKMNKMYCSGLEYTFVNVIDVASYDSINEWIPYLFTDMKINDSDVQLSNFRKVTPLTLVSQDEWDVAWLLICGYTIRDIAVILNFNKSTIESRIDNVYMNLQVVNKIGLLRVAKFYGWIRFVPDRYSSEPFLLKID